MFFPRFRKCLFGESRIGGEQHDHHANHLTNDQLFDHHHGVQHDLHGGPGDDIFGGLAASMEEDGWHESSATWMSQEVRING